MSARLAMRVLESALPVALKPIATTMALFGNDAGERIYPSVDRLAFLLSVSHRTVERQLADLRARGVLVPQTGLEGGRLPGGRGRSVLYRLNIEALPSRQAFKPRRQCQGSQNGNPDAGDGVQPPEPDTPTLTTSTPTPVTHTPTAVTKNPDASVTRSYRSDLLEEREREKSYPREERAAVLSRKEEGKERTPAQRIEHHCEECDWQGDAQNSARHYRETRHQMKTVAVEIAQSA